MSCTFNGFIWMFLTIHSLALFHSNCRMPKFKQHTSEFQYMLDSGIFFLPMAIFIRYHHAYALGGGLPGCLPTQGQKVNVTAIPTSESKWTLITCRYRQKKPHPKELSPAHVWLSLLFSTRTAIFYIYFLIRPLLNKIFTFLQP